MNNEVLKLINIYSKETKFSDNLKDLINILSDKINYASNHYNSNDILHNFYHSNKFDEIKNEAIEPIINKMVKNDVKIDTSIIPWSNGEHETGDANVVEYEITYNLNSHIITFHIHSLLDEKTVIYASILIDDWLHFILMNHDGELGYYQEDGDRGIQTYNETKSELFYKEFNIENIYNDIKEFYTHLLRVSFLCITKYLGCKLDNDYVEFV